MNETLDTHGISLAMRNRWRLADGYAMIEEVGNGTGANCRRHADAIVMNLWPSRGLEIMGFEYKASRSDWVKELKSPEKADPVFAFCDRWYLVVGDPAIVKPGELPANWGLMVPSKAFEGKEDAFTLRDKVGAPKLEPSPLNRSFVGAMLRAAAKETVSETMLKRVKDSEYNRGYQAGMDQGKRMAHGDADSYKHLQESVDAFELASGIRITSYSDGKALGDMVKVARQLIANGGWSSLDHLLRRTHEAAKALSSGVKQIRDSVHKHMTERVDAGLLTGQPAIDPSEDEDNLNATEEA